VRNATSTGINASDLAQLVLGLLGRDLLNDESSLDVEQQSVVTVSNLLQSDHIHESGGELDVSSDLAVDSDQSLLENHEHLSLGEGESQSVSQEDDQGQTLSRLVRTSRGFGSKDSGQLVKHPVLGSCETFQTKLMLACL